MSKNDALEKWIEDDMRDVPCALPAEEASEYMCREAWHAAVQHTLGFVVEKLRRRDVVTDCVRPNKWDYAEFVRNLNP